MVVSRAVRRSASLDAAHSALGAAGARALQVVHVVRGHTRAFRTTPAMGRIDATLICAARDRTVGLTAVNSDPSVGCLQKRAESAPSGPELGPNMIRNRRNGFTRPVGAHPRAACIRGSLARATTASRGLIPGPEQVLHQVGRTAGFPPPSGPGSTGANVPTRSPRW